MDLKQIKGKLDQLQNKGGGNSKKREKIDYTKYYWKPKPGKHIIRFVPSKFDADNPFREVFFHYNVARFPIMALSNWNEKDPITDFAYALNKQGETESKAMAKKLFPKMRVFAPVIVRGEEEKGVRLYEFGKAIYQELLACADDEDIGDFTNVKDGLDFTITKVSAEEEGSMYGSTSIRPKVKITPLSKDAKFIKECLENQPDIFELYKRNDFDSLKDILAKWVNESEEGADDNEASTDSSYSLGKAAEGKPSKEGKFDEMFKETKA